MYDARHTANGPWKQGPRILAALLLALLLPASAHVASSQAPPADSALVAPAATPAAPEAPATPPEPAPAQTAGDSAVAAVGGTIRADADTDTLPDADGGWPRLILAPSGAHILLYQPQMVSWADQRHLVAMAAVSYTPKGATKADLGTIRLESATSTSIEERMVNLINVELTSMTFSSLEKLESQEVLAEIKKSLPKDSLLVSLDRVLAAADTSMISGKGIKVNTEPPPIFYSAKPAILVQFDGEPIFIPIETTSLRYVVNTNWDVFQDTDTKLYLLRNDTYWLQSVDLKTWVPVEKLPVGFEKLKSDDNWKDVKDNIPGKKISKGKMPVVFVSKTPAELILIDGKPKYEQVEPTKLRWVKNTESDLFRYDGKNKKKTFYVLLSGRWFRTDELEKGPWTFATSDLPDDFANIPRGHERARVLSSVPGTGEAAQAILLASVPRTAQVDAKNLKPPDVKYDGDPQFKPIPGTSVSYADNSPFDVLKVGDTYYLCFQAVWFKSASPAGPFTVATEVPPEIYTIPAESPMQHVTYVTVVDDDDDYPTYAYTAGYVGVSVAFGCAMWGTGYYYPPYYHGGMYYPRPVAYGGGVSYNPWTGAYGGYQAAYGPYGGVARGAAYNPSTGTYARGGMAWGPGGSKGYAQAYNPRTGTYASTRQGSNVYGSWGSSHVQRGDNWVNSQRVTDSHGNTKWKAQGSGGGGAAGWNTNRGSGFVGQSGNGDVYAGRDGNVYRKTDSGWQQHQQGGGWSDVGGGQGGANRPSQQPSGGAGNRPSQQPGASQRPSQQPSAGQLDRDAQARSRGQQQTRAYSNQQRGGSSSAGRSSGGSRGGGGGGRGGGGRRR